MDGNTIDKEVYWAHHDMTALSRQSLPPASSQSIQRKKLYQNWLMHEWLIVVPDRLVVVSEWHDVVSVTGSVIWVTGCGIRVTGYGTELQPCMFSDQNEVIESHKHHLYLVCYK